MPEDPFIHQTVFAYCEKCKKLVSVVPLFTRPQTVQAFQTGADLEVMHTSASVAITAGDWTRGTEGISRK